MNDKLARGFQLMGEGLVEEAGLLHLALVYDPRTNTVDTLVHSFDDLVVLRNVLQTVIVRIESGDHQEHRVVVRTG